MTIAPHPRRLEDVVSEGKEEEMVRYDVLINEEDEDGWCPNITNWLELCCQLLLGLSVPTPHYIPTSRIFSFFLLELQPLIVAHILPEVEIG